jgi:serine/threonine protein kinase
VKITHEFQISKSSEGKRLDDWALVSNMGDGTFSNNFIYKNVLTGQLAAFKFYKSEVINKKKRIYDECEAPIDRIQRECRIWAQLANDHIARLYEWFQSEGKIVARSELGDLGLAGNYSQSEENWTMKPEVFKMFQEKIVSESKIYFGLEEKKPKADVGIVFFLLFKRLD